MIEARSRTMANAVRAAAVGLATGILLVLLAGILTAVVGIATHSSEAGDVLGSATNVAGIAEGVVVGLPHATGAGLVASMGVPARFEAEDHGGEVGEYATASIFGGERQQRDRRRGFDPSGPPGPYPLNVPSYALAGLAIAIAFTIVTGYRAAAGAATVRESVSSVVLAAGCLTVVFWILGYLVGGELDVRLYAGSEFDGTRLAIGPNAVEALVLPPIWTLGGGAVGAILHGLRRPSSSRPRSTES